MNTAEIRQLFPLSKGGTVAGCMVTDGRIKRGKVRVMRGEELFTGPIHTLKRFKDNIDVVRSGMDRHHRTGGRHPGPASHAVLRHERVRELLKRTVGDILRRELSTEECGLVSVNDVGVASDLFGRHLC